MYEEIEKKRRRSIEDMILLCEIGMGENGNEEMKDFIHLYFNSKYAKVNHEIDGENYSLTLDIQEERNSFDILWKYIDATTKDPSGAQKDNTKHLRGATLRILRYNEDGSLFLLKAYSLFVLGLANESIKKEAVDALVYGFKLLKDKFKLSFEELSQNISNLEKEIINNAENKEEVASILNDVFNEIYLEHHNAWLKNFNAKYLQDYDKQ